MSRILLLDSDIIAYQVSAINQESYDFGDTRVVDADADKAKKDAEEVILELVEKLDADEVVVCLTDPNAEWRKEFYPRYKAHRKPENKPVLLGAVKAHLASHYPSYVRPRLEADDVMGILSTHPRILSKFRERIIVSEDKDLRTIPGLLYNPNHPEQNIQEISELDADRFHMWQTLVGDPTDGYPGCPGIGAASMFAQDIIFADRGELWDEVVTAYASKGFTEEDALVQARLARILRWYDFNYQTKKVRLWTPLLLSN